MKNMLNLFLTLLIPFLYFLGLIVILQTMKITNFLLVVLGLMVAFLGLFLWGFGFYNLGRPSFSVLPKAKKLQTNGLYKYFRHPIYLGITLTLLGLSLSTSSLLGFIYTTIIILPLNMLRARNEERVLIAKFGPEYLEYRKKTII